MEAAQQREELLKTAIMLWYKNYERLGNIQEELDDIRHSMVRIEMEFARIAGVKDVTELAGRYLGTER